MSNKLETFHILLDMQQPQVLDTVAARLKKNAVFIVSCYDDEWCYVDGALTGEYCLYDIDSLYIMPDGTLYDERKTYNDYYMKNRKRIDITKKQKENNEVIIEFTTEDMTYKNFEFFDTGRYTTFGNKGYAKDSELKPKSDLKFIIHNAIFDLNSIKRQFVLESFNNSCAFCGADIGLRKWHSYQFLLNSDEHEMLYKNSIIGDNLGKTICNMPTCLKCSGIISSEKFNEYSKKYFDRDKYTRNVSVQYDNNNPTKCYDLDIYHKYIMENITRFKHYDNANIDLFYFETYLTEKEKQEQLELQEQKKEVERILKQSEKERIFELVKRASKVIPLFVLTAGAYTARKLSDYMLVALEFLGEGNEPVELEPLTNEDTE